MSLKVEKIFVKSFFLENLDYQDSHATNRINSIPPQYFSPACCFLKTEFLTEEIEIVAAEEYQSENGAKQKKVALLGNFELSRH